MDTIKPFDFPARMTSDHPVPFPAVNSILHAVSADSLCFTSTQDTNSWRKELEMSDLTSIYNDIYTSTNLQNQKKEVTDDKMNLKQCKTNQYNLYLTQA